MWNDAMNDFSFCQYVWHVVVIARNRISDPMLARCARRSNKRRMINDDDRKSEHRKFKGGRVVEGIAKRRHVRSNLIEYQPN